MKSSLLGLNLLLSCFASRSSGYDPEARARPRISFCANSSGFTRNAESSPPDPAPNALDPFAAQSPVRSPQGIDGRDAQNVYRLPPPPRAFCFTGTENAKLAGHGFRWSANI
jgi:hypothetical protein